jgi:hypothetical protein
VRGAYSKEQILELLGEPIGSEGYLQIPGGSVADVLVFACGCRGMQNGNRYDLTPPCRRHGGPDALRISDRRCGPIAFGNLSFVATGLLLELVRHQEFSERDADGCAHVTFPAAALRPAEAVEELMRANVLRRRADDNYELRWFTCYDASTEEWY